MCLVFLSVTIVFMKFLLNQLLLKPKRSIFINTGAVGQPRDGDWRASYCIYDTDRKTVHFRRIEYDIQTAQAKIIAAGLPEFLAERLAQGR